jgi:hypothetical protein
MGLSHTFDTGLAFLRAGASSLLCAVLRGDTVMKTDLETMFAVYNLTLLTL